MKRFTTLVIKYPNGTTQHVRPNMQLFNGNWDALAEAVGGYWFRDRMGNIGKIPYELK